MKNTTRRAAEERREAEKNKQALVKAFFLRYPPLFSAALRVVSFSYAIPINQEFR
jgi:hypothetical protein